MRNVEAKGIEARHVRPPDMTEGAGQMPLQFKRAMRYGTTKPLRFAGAVALALVIGVSTSAGARAETLADAMVSAYKHSGLLEQNRAVLRAADEGVAQAVSALRPVLSFSAGVAHNYGEGTSIQSNVLVSGGTVSNTGSMGITAQLALYAGGKNKLNVALAKEAVLQTRQQLINAEQIVLLNAVSAFMEVRRQYEVVNLRQNNLRLIREELRAARDRFEVGEVTRTDVSLAEARLAAAQSGLSAARGALMQAQNLYANVVGHKPGNLSQPPAVPKTVSSMEEAKALATRNHPLMIAAQHGVRQSELNVAVADAALKPQVNLEASYGKNGTFGSAVESTGGSVSLGVAQPLYQGGRLSSLQRAAMAQRDQARASLHITRHDLAQSAADAFAGLQVARASRESGILQVRAARVAFRGVREEATLGARTTLDVLNAEQELLDAQASLISAVVDEQVAAYSVLARIGALTAKALRLGIQEYDPADYYNKVQSAPAGLSQQGRDLDRVLRAIGKN